MARAIRLARTETPAFARFEPLETRRHFDGQYDNAFSFDGRVITSFGQAGAAEAMAVRAQPDGKAVASGYAAFVSPINGNTTRRAVVARYNVDGTLDNTFEGDGQWLGPAPISGLQQYRGPGVAIQTDGKIVVLVSTLDNGAMRGGELRRLNADGSIDTTFGTNGTLRILNEPTSVEVKTVDIDDHGRVVVAGNFGDDGLVARYTPAGQVDVSFGTNGRTILPRGSAARLFVSDTTLDDDDKIIVSATAESPNSRLTIRLRTDGAFDNDFALGGVLRNDLGSATGQAKAVAVQLDGAIWQGSFLNTASNPNTAIQMRRVLADGSFANNYGPVFGTGLGVTAMERMTNNLMLQLIPGNSYPRVQRFRLGASIAIETGLTFNSGSPGVGTSEIQWSTSPNVDEANGMALSPSGRLYVAGSTVPSGQPRQFAVAALVAASNQGPIVESREFEFETGHVVRFSFNEAIIPASIDPSDVVIRTSTGSQLAIINSQYDATTRTIRFEEGTIAILPDGNYTAEMNLNSVVDPQLAGNANTGFFKFFVFAGDANRDRAININDFSILASRFNLAGTFSQGDFNYDGVANISDFSILASKFNTTLPAARGAASSIGMKVFDSENQVGREMDEIDAIRSQVL